MSATDKTGSKAPVVMPSAPRPSGPTLDQLLAPAGTPANNALGPKTLPNGMQDKGYQFSLPKGYDPNVAAFQKAHGGLVVDGILGPKTIAAGYGRAAAKPAAPAHKTVPAPGGGHPTGGGGGSRTAVSASGGSGGMGGVGGGVAIPSSAPRMASDSFLQQATNSVNAELNPQIAELQRQIDLATQHYNNDKNDVTAQGTRTQNDLAALYQRLGDLTQGIQGVQDKNYANTANANANRYAALQQQVAQTFQGQQQSTQAELARLGISGMTGNAGDALTRDAGYLKGLTGVDAANTAANESASRNAFDALMGTARGNAATEGTVQRGQASRDNAKQLADLLSAFNDTRTTLAGKKGDIEGTRGQKIQELVQALTQQKAAADAAAQQQAFENMLAQNKFNLDLSNSSFDHTLANQRLTLDQQKAQAAATAKAAGGGAAKPATGYEGAYSLIPHTANYTDVINELNGLLGGTYKDDLGPIGKPGQLGAGKPSPSDPITVAHLMRWAQQNKTGNITQADVNNILKALAAYSKNLGHA